MMVVGNSSCPWARYRGEFVDAVLRIVVEAPALPMNSTAAFGVDPYGIELTVQVFGDLLVGIGLLSICLHQPHQLVVEIDEDRPFSCSRRVAASSMLSQVTEVL